MHKIILSQCANIFGCMDIFLFWVHAHIFDVENPTFSAELLPITLNKNGLIPSPTFLDRNSNVLFSVVLVWKSVHCVHSVHAVCTCLPRNVSDEYQQYRCTITWYLSTCHLGLHAIHPYKSWVTIHDNNCMHPSMDTTDDEKEPRFTCLRGLSALFVNSGKSSRVFLPIMQDAHFVCCW